MDRKDRNQSDRCVNSTKHQRSHAESVMYAHADQLLAHPTVTGLRIREIGGRQEIVMMLIDDNFECPSEIDGVPVTSEVTGQIIAAS